MNVSQRFLEQLAYLERFAPPPELLATRLAVCCFEVLPVAAAALSVFTPDGFRFPVGASSPRAAYAERLQFSTGEGPAVDLDGTGDGIVADSAVVALSWPRFHADLVRDTPYRAVAAFPLVAGGAVWATVDLYFTSDADLQRLPLPEAQAVVELVGRHLSASAGPDDGWPGDPVNAARRVTRTAVGMLDSAYAMTADEALTALRAHAAARRITVDALADAVVGQRIPLDDIAPSGASPVPPIDAAATPRNDDRDLS